MAAGNGLAGDRRGAVWAPTVRSRTFAPGVGPLHGREGPCRVVAARIIRAHRVALLGNWRLIGSSAVATAVYPLAFYTSMTGRRRGRHRRHHRLRTRHSGTPPQ